ncbi:MAG: DUF2304 domain-containing protein [Bacteroidetes bacterium]|nr:DUF2304 domain-containing protein [Bacteroidota bacterium]
MNAIQILLIGGVIAIFIYYIARFRSALVDLIILSLFSIAAIFFILYPDETTVIANKLGVQRGADLLFYCCILFFLFIVVKLFARVRRLEQKLTEVIRQRAKDEATVPKDH